MLVGSEERVVIKMKQYLGSVIFFFGAIVVCYYGVQNICFPLILGGFVLFIGACLWHCEAVRQARFWAKVRQSSRQ